MINRERQIVEIPVKSFTINGNSPLTKEELIETIEMMDKEAKAMGYKELLYKFDETSLEILLSSFVKRFETDLEYKDRINYELEREDDRRHQYNELKKEFEK